MEDAPANMDYIDDFEALIENQAIIPGDREQSRIYVRMVAGTMPPLTVSEPVPPEEIEIVGQYIDSL